MNPLPTIAPLPPALKWAGGKRWLVPTLAALWQPYAERRLIEPFVGGLAVALGLRPRRATLGDANPHLINFWRHLKQGLVINLPMANDSTLFYQYRQRFNALIDEGREESQEAAELFYFLNRTGFNGLCRFNASGYFNVPFGRYKTINYTQDFRAYSAVLRNWWFVEQDFEDLARDPDDFIYADPPYDTPFTTYSAGGFDWYDQIRLAVWLSRHPGPVVTSNQATPRILSIYQELGFSIRLLNAPRRISCTGDRTHAQEMLATRGI